MFEIILYCNNLLLKNTKKQYFLLLFFNLFSSTTQILGIATLYPLILILTDPQIIFKNSYYINYFPFQNYSTENQVLVFSLIFLFFIITNILINFFTNFFQNYFVFTIVNKIKINLFKSFLEIDLNKNKLIDKSVINNLIGPEVTKIKIFIDSFLKIITDIILFLGLVLTMGLLDYYFLFFMLGTSSIFLIIFILLKKILYNNSVKFSKLNQKIANNTWHMTHAYQDIMLFNLKNFFLRNLDDLNQKLLKINTANIFFSSFPRYFVEILIFVFLVVYINSNFLGMNLLGSLPKITISLFVLWRLYPIISSLNRSFANIKANQFSYENFSKLSNFFNANILNKNIAKKKLSFYDKILIKDVKFNYPKSKKIYNFNFTIKKNDIVHIDGASGKGKSTFFNLLSGMTACNSGEILLDGKNINKNLVNYWKIIGYVSQKPYLIKNSLAWNIALKNNLSKNDYYKLKKIYRVCQLNKLVNNFNDLFKKYIFTDAVDLSGGQKQRLQIARVLFKEPKILLLDESFNALDKISETKIITNIKKNYPDLTMLISSHRPIKNFFNKKISIN